MTDRLDARARFERRAVFVAYMLAPLVGYGAAQFYERWSAMQPWLAGLPVLRIPLGIATLALGGWLGYLALSTAGRGLSRILARGRSP